MCTRGYAWVCMCTRGYACVCMGEAEGVHGGGGAHLRMDPVSSILCLFSSEDPTAALTVFQLWCWASCSMGGLYAV